MHVQASIAFPHANQQCQLLSGTSARKESQTENRIVLVLVLHCVSLDLFDAVNDQILVGLTHTYLDEVL